MYDLIIVGAGPAGMTAAIYAARRKLKFLIISLDVGGQVGWSSEVDNYLGLPDLTGIQLVEKFQKHIQDYKIKIKQEEILEIKKDKKTRIINVKTKKSVYETKSVIIATGKKPKKLGVLGEENYLGKGVNYCATCDAPLYRDKKVVVVGGGNSGMEAALFLAKYAKRVYLMEARDKLMGEPYLKEQMDKDKKISIITNANVKEIMGSQFVEKITYESKGALKSLDVGGIFVEIGLVAEVNFTDVQKNKWGEIMIYRSTINHEENLTDTPGIFAAGDVTDVPSKQIIVAAGEGAKAALAAINYVLQFK